MRTTTLHGNLTTWFNLSIDNRTRILLPMVSHHHYACVALECVGIHNKCLSLLQVEFSIISSGTSFGLTLSLLQ